METQPIVDSLNEHTLPFIEMLGGRVIAIDLEAQTCTFEFNVSQDFCHSVDIVQGGFVTAMLDAAMSHAVFALGEDIVNLSSLEITTRYLEATRSGKLIAIGKITKAAYKTAFLEGELRDTDGKLLATSQTVAKVIRKKVGCSTSSK